MAKKDPTTAETTGSGTATAEAELAGRDVPRPEHWGGFRIRPFEIEFWQGQQNRFHDRWVFRRADGSHDPGDLARSQDWDLVRLYP